MHSAKPFFIAALPALFAGRAMALPGDGGASNAYEVAAAAERLRVAMINPTAAALGALIADDLSYGHSDGRVDTKASFVSDLMDGKSDFSGITITGQTIKVVDATTAIVRHSFAADTNDAGKPGKVALKILCIWQSQGDAWRLLARQAVRIQLQSK